MYLSRVSLSGEYAVNPYQYHRGLWQLFSDSTERKRDFLYRLESKKNRQAFFLVQSLRKPYSIIENTSVNILASKSWEPQFYNDQLLRFFILANPVKTIKDKQKRSNAKGQVKSCRVPIIDWTEQQAWLVKKLLQSAELLEVDINPVEAIYFRKAKLKNAGKIQPVRYQGILRIINADHFSQLIKIGVGPAKSFGCGMLSVASMA